MRMELSQFVDELRKWTERNPIQTKSNEKPLRGNLTRHNRKTSEVVSVFIVKKPDHRSVNCKTVTTLDERKRLLSNKHL